MTDRYNALTVVLEQDIRDDDAEPLIEAIKMLKGVVDVQGNVPSVDSFVAQSRVDQKWRNHLVELLEKVPWE